MDISIMISIIIVDWV